MVSVIFDPHFQKTFKKIKDNKIKQKIVLQVKKIKDNPEIGKPMRYTRKKTRELYIAPFRLSYCIRDGKVCVLDLYHKDNQ